MATKETLDKRTLSTNNYLALMAVLTLLSVLITGFILNSIGKEFILNTKVILGKQKAVNDLEVKLENAKDLSQSYKNLGETRELIEHAMPNTSDFPQIVSLINGAATAAGVRVTTISPKPSLASSTTSEKASSGQAIPYSFGIDVEGSYARLRDFTRNLELSARPMKVDAIQIKGNDSSLRSSMQITTYYQDEATLEDKKEPVK